MVDSLGRVQTLGANFSAVHDSVAAEELESIVQESKALSRLFVTRIFDPSVCLHVAHSSEQKQKEELYG